MPRPVERGAAVGTDEEAGVRAQARGCGLGEEQRLPEPALHDVLAHCGVGGEARHQDDGNLRVERACETLRLVELHLEKAAAVERLGDRLDPTAEARRHATGEDDHRDPAASQCLFAGRGRLGESGLPGGRQLRQVGIERRLDDPVHHVAAAAQRAVGELAP